MVVLVDGYNYIKTIFPEMRAARVQGSRQAERIIISVLDQVNSYFGAEKEAGELDRITIVFDGGLFNHAQRDVYKNISIIYPGRGHHADDWIADYIKKHRGDGQYVLISSDRKLGERVAEYGCAVRDVFFFESLLSQVSEDSGLDSSECQDRSAKSRNKIFGKNQDTYQDNYQDNYVDTRFDGLENFLEETYGAPDVDMGALLDGGDLLDISLKKRKKDESPVERTGGSGYTQSKQARADERINRRLYLK